MSCEQCGKCCHAGVTLAIEDMNREPRLFQVAVPIHRVGNPKTRAFMAEKKHPWAINKPHRGAPCPFYFDGCTIYETRPQVCRDYPENGGLCIKEKENAPTSKH